jgi:hypothetical protein
MTINVKVCTPIKEDKYLEGHEIHYNTKYILVSPEIYKILDIIQNDEKKVNNLLGKAEEVSEEQLIVRRAGLLTGQVYTDLAKHKRRNSRAGRRRNS